MSLDGLQDNYFGCGETPLYIPADYNINTVAGCTSCKLKLTSFLAGPGNVTRREDGLLINENPTVTFAVNGIQHSLVETVMMIPGAHRLPGVVDVYPAELAFYFRNTLDFSKEVCLTLPLTIAPGATNPYFATLGASPTGSRPVAGTLFNAESRLISFRGADLRGRTASSSRPSSLCSPVRRVTTYYVCLTPAAIASADYQRLKALAGATGPAKPITVTQTSRIQQLCTRIEGMRIETKSPAALKRVDDAGAGVQTSAMKCYRLDKNRDIQNDRVFVGGAAAYKSLAEELNAPAASEAGALGLPEGGDVDGGVKPGDIEHVVGIVIGVVIGLIICAFIFVFLWSNTFRQYFNVQKLYENPVSASSITSKFPTLKLPSLCGPK
jgi:hypothetical protein